MAGSPESKVALDSLLTPGRSTCLFFPGGGVLPSNRLMGMCRWIGSHFHGWIDYCGVSFSLELLEWDRTFSGLGGSESSST